MSKIEEEESGQVVSRRTQSLDLKQPSKEQVEAYMKRYSTINDLSKMDLDAPLKTKNPKKDEEP